MILSIITLFLAIPAGYLIAWLARDELVDGRRWFKILIFSSIFFGILGFFSGLNSIGFSCLFISIAASVSLKKGFDKKWTKKRFK